MKEDFGSIESGDSQIKRAAQEAAPGAQVVRSDGDLLVYYSGFNLSKFVRFLALQPYLAADGESGEAVAWQARDKVHGGIWMHCDYPHSNPDYEYRPLYVTPTAPAQSNGDAELDKWNRAERDLSAAYVRLRALIPGALDTPHAPSPEQVWKTTEDALTSLRAQLEAARKALETAQRHLYKYTGGFAANQEEQAVFSLIDAALTPSPDGPQS